MSLTIMRRIKFCAGHRLHKHGGKCEHFHGHNYMADFYVTGDQVDDVGRVIDFAELKKLFKGWIDENWDHGFVLNKDDENGLAAVKIVVPCRYYVLPYNPTSENMATYLLREVCPELLAGKGVSATKVVMSFSGLARGQGRIVLAGTGRLTDQPLAGRTPSSPYAEERTRNERDPK